MTSMPLLHCLALLSSALILNLIVVSSVAFAHDDNAQAAAPHVRTLTHGLDERVAEGASRAPTFAAIVEQLHRSDVIAYIRCGLKDLTRFGQLQFVGARSGLRYLLIEMRCPMNRDVLIAGLAHELRHAVEIAEAPWVTDVAAMQALYSVIGIDTTGDARRFESRAAIDAATAVRRELDDGQRATTP